MLRNVPHATNNAETNSLVFAWFCKKLRARYNVTPEKHNISTKITLPNSKAVADVLWNDAKAAFTSLLSDPRIVDSDHLE